MSKEVKLVDEKKEAEFGIQLRKEGVFEDEGTPHDLLTSSQKIKIRGGKRKKYSPGGYSSFGDVGR